MEFRLAHSYLHPGGKPVDKLVLQRGAEVTLELGSAVAGANAPDIQESRRGVVALSVPVQSAGRWTLTLKFRSYGETRLNLLDAGGHPSTRTLRVFAGTVGNHDGMETDLIAEVFRGNDLARQQGLIELLDSQPDNLFNQNSSTHLAQWGADAAATVALLAGTNIFQRDLKYTYGRYHIPVQSRLEGEGPLRRRVMKIDGRDEVLYESATLDKGLDAIRRRLMHGCPVILGLCHAPGQALQRDGTLNPMSAGGHSVLAVGCSADGLRLLYIDPCGPESGNGVASGGSLLKYLGGPAGVDAFPLPCAQLGMIEMVNARGGVLLRQEPATQAPGGRFDGDRYLEVVAGPLV